MLKSIENKFAYTYQKSGKTLPDGIIYEPDLCLGLAWDNYDANVDTLDGKKSLHITVGIVYQNYKKVSVPPGETQSEAKTFTDDVVNNSDVEKTYIEAYYEPLNKARLDFWDLNDGGEVCKTIVLIDFLHLGQVFFNKPMPLHQGFNAYFFVE